ncbi:adrenocortical dysplasia protein homolog [Plectropomus leopardus]|uniref:adrenocortical dysplasia protein homolog n=1 Tax=Plectropomus leopardus TaxID=160734 RepID=UPI001C4B1BAA|nr:adrenocortical dysplasia protein homolog [Plectropomus leopardus]
MSRPARSTVSPWVESLILSYGGEEQSSSSGRLKAHVIGVGQMSQSQAQGSEGPTGLLFLSDGVLQIPAILTASAWEHLQEQEDRECFTSLLNTTVCIQDYRLLFHMSIEQTKCRFFLSVGELASTAAGPVKHNTPCCMTLPAIRMKVCKTWRALLGQEDSQRSQCGFDLSELLGEWQHDCLQAVLEDVRERLSSRPVSPQPSTSTGASSLSHADTLTATSWDADRVRYKGAKCFSVPMKCLIIPDEDTELLNAGFSAASEDRKTDLLQVCKSPETTPPSADDAEWRISKPGLLERDAIENPPSPVDSLLHEALMIDSDIRPLSNPWDIFPPCDTISLSDASPEATPPQSENDPAATEFKSDHAAILTSTQLPVSSWEESRQTSENSRGEQSELPPYQNLLPHSTSLPETSVSPPEFLKTPSHVLLATAEHQTDTPQQNLPVLGQEKQEDETADGKHRKAKRKRSEPTQEALATLVEEEIGGSPPSWLFDSQTGSGAEDGSSHTRGESVGTVPRKSPTVHSDGRPFSYSYQVSGQNLQDFSRFKVAESFLRWAVKYLLPKQTENSHDPSATSDCTDRTEVTSL